MTRKETNHILTEWDTKMLAWHEAGHAVCSFFLPETETIQSISIEPCSDAFGAMKSEPHKKMNMTYVSCLNKISVAMGGRLSEEIFQKEVSSSCVHDLEKIQFLAMHMVCKLGMGKRTGIITWVSHGTDGPLFLFSEKQRNDIYEDIKEITTEAEKQARQTLMDHSGKVKQLAEYLLKHKVIFAKEISEILA